MSKKKNPNGRLKQRPVNDEYIITMDKSIVRWLAELRFINILEHKSKTWVYEPTCLKTGNILKSGEPEIYIPDFYCPEDLAYYEISNTSAAYKHSVKKIIGVIEREKICIIVVKPNGDIIQEFGNRKNFAYMSISDVNEYPEMKSSDWLKDIEILLSKNHRAHFRRERLLRQLTKFYPEFKMSCSLGGFDEKFHNSDLFELKKMGYVQRKKFDNPRCFRYRIRRKFIKEFEGDRGIA